MGVVNDSYCELMQVKLCKMVMEKWQEYKEHELYFLRQEMTEISTTIVVE